MQAGEKSGISGTRNHRYAAENNLPTCTQQTGKTLKWIAGGIGLARAAALATGTGFLLTGSNYNVSDGGYGVDQVLFISACAAELGVGVLWCIGSAMEKWGGDEDSESAEKNPFVMRDENGQPSSIQRESDSDVLIFCDRYGNTHPLK